MDESSSLTLVTVTSLTTDSTSTKRVRGKWEPATWQPWFTEVCRMAAVNIPTTNIQRALKRYGHHYSGRHIQRILETQRGQELVSMFSAYATGGIAQLRDDLTAFTPEAISTELDIMRNPLGSERYRLNAAQDVLDRGGLPKVSRQESDNKLPQTVIINLLPSQVSALLQPPPPIEAEYVILDQPSSSI